MALALKDRVKETTIVVGTGTATLLGSSIGFQPFSVVGNGNTTYYCISDQFGSNWEVGIGTYSSSGNTLARTTVLASSNAGALVVFTAGVKDVFVTYPAEKGVWLDASNNAIGLGTPAAFVGTNITGTASGLTAGNVTTNANLTGAVTSTGNATSLGSFTSLQLATALTDETGSGSAVFATSPTLANPTYTGTLTGGTGILNIGSGQLYKDASGNVGIGTSTPGMTLEIESQTPATNTINVVNVLGLTRPVTSGVKFGNAANFTLGSFGTSIQSQSRLGINLADGNSSTPNTEIMTLLSSGNVGIGTSSPQAKLQVTDSAHSCQMFIGYTDNNNYYQSNGAQIWSTYNGTAERMRIDSSGNLLVGTTSPYSSSHTFSKNPGAGQFATSILNSKTDNSTATLGLLVKYTGVTPNDGNHIFRCEDSGGTQRFYVQNNGTTGGTSDARLKNNITDSTPKLSDLLNIKVRNFYWNDNENDKNLGFIAQEVEEIFPALIVEDDNGYKTIKHSVFTPMLVKAIQELKAIIDTQQEQINSLLGK